MKVMIHRSFKGTHNGVHETHSTQRSQYTRHTPHRGHHRQFSWIDHQIILELHPKFFLGGGINLLYYNYLAAVCSEEAVREAKGDGDKLKERAEEEESLATLDELEQIRTKANSMVSSEKQALTEDRDHFSSDMDRIGELSIVYS